MMQEEMEALRAMLDERRNSQLKKEPMVCRNYHNEQTAAAN